MVHLKNEWHRHRTSTHRSSFSLVHLNNGLHRHTVLYTHHSSFPLVHLDNGYHRHTVLLTCVLSPPGQWISTSHVQYYILTTVHFLSSTWTMDITVTQCYSPVSSLHLDNGYQRHTYSTIYSPQFISSRPPGQSISPSHSAHHSL